MKQILPFININGKIVDQKSAQISILNQGFLYGKGIFTTIKVREGIPLFFERHLNRLQTSASQLDITSSPLLLGEGQGEVFNSSKIQKAAYATITKNKLINGGIRITLTPGIICIHAFTTDTKTQKVAVITTPDTRDGYKIHKLTYRIPHLLAQQQAQAKGARDALFTQNGKLIESTTANIISFIDKNTLITPPISGKGLNGITGQILIKNLPIKEKAIPSDTTGPIILVNSLNLRIVESIDGRKLKQNSEFVNLIRQTLDKTEKTYITNNNF